MYSEKYFIEQLKMEEHPEGGYYYSKHVSEQLMETPVGNRAQYTSIYFLLRSEDISHLHRLQFDEVWYYHAGSALTVHMIHPDGTYEAQKLGLNIAAGEQPQIIVPKHTIFGSSVEDDNTFSLVGCMVSPGFDYADFELFTQAELINQYPEHTSVIKKMAFETIE